MSREELKLKLNNADIDAFPFINTPFDVAVYLSDINDQIYQGNIDVPLQISLCGDDNKVVEDSDNIMTISPANVIIGKTGTATIRVTLKKLSMTVGNKKFKLLVSASTVKEFYVKPVSSPLLTCVLYKLRVTEENTSQFIWFKDEGGREKCIELHVSLRDAAGEIVRRRKVKLRMTLCYSSGVEVSREAQKILTMPEHFSKIISEDTGETDISYRINEVSKGHQSQAFRVLISPDVSTSPMNADIAPCSSTPVEVRSKRNNTSSKRGRDTAMCNVFDAAGSVSVTASNSVPNLNALGQQIPASVGGGNLTTKKSKKNGNTDIINSFSSGNAFITELNKIVLWNNSVIEQLQAMQWKGPIGYTEGGPGNPAVPIYNIPNPIESINQLLTTYEETVVASTNTLMSLSRGQGVALGASEGGEMGHRDVLFGYQQRSNATDSSTTSFVANGMGYFNGDCEDTGDFLSNDPSFTGVHRNNSLFASDLYRGSSAMPLSMISGASFLDGSNATEGDMLHTTGIGMGISMGNGIDMLSGHRISKANSAVPSSTHTPTISDKTHFILPVPYTLVDNDLLSSSKSSGSVNRLVSPEDRCKEDDQGRSIGCASFGSDGKLIGFHSFGANAAGQQESFFIEALPEAFRASHGYTDQPSRVLLSPTEIDYLEKQLQERQRKASHDHSYLVDPMTPYDVVNCDKLYDVASFPSLKLMVDAVVVAVDCKYEITGV